jgi:U3 small nucleolar RNA-associated protein 23
LVDPPTSKDLKKRRGPKGPNPLSMKKKKINEASRQAHSSMIVDNESDAKVSAGSKRKADFSEENGVEDDDVIQQTSNSNPKTRRRKRRKNHINQDTAHLTS